MSLPNANVADALGRLPGVTLRRNEEQGRYVRIRGTEPRLSNTTMDGVIVPGPIRRTHKLKQMPATRHREDRVTFVASRHVPMCPKMDTDFR
ncbi:MAG: TonB-dependent receptor plug domain-containing protein [Acidobacteriaceae bacterium]